ncbi:MAG TPA: DoxX family protein [Chloroflexota bacterium]|nr:DoxX family protein [Chloroflexota bacterium]
MATTYVRQIGVSDSDNVTTVKRASRLLSASLWTLQGSLALIFVMTGAMKVLMPAEMLEAQSPLPVIVSRFVGLCELAGALGLILPGLLRIRPILTPLAAPGLVVLMICATILTPILVSPDPVMMLLPATVGGVAAFVGYARLRLAPLRAR